MALGCKMRSAVNKRRHRGHWRNKSLSTRLNSREVPGRRHGPRLCESAPSLSRLCAHGCGASRACLQRWCAGVWQEESRSQSTLVPDRTDHPKVWKFYHLETKNQTLATAVCLGTGLEPPAPWARGSGFPTAWQV